jgi:hypothetical protein
MDSAMAKEAAAKLNRSLFIKEGEEEEKKDEEAAANSRPSRCFSALKKAVVFTAVFFFAGTIICLLAAALFPVLFLHIQKEGGMTTCVMISPRGRVDFGTKWGKGFPHFTYVSFSFLLCIIFSSLKNIFFIIFSREKRKKTRI